MTIVNPAALEPSLRDAVCQQCHLIGQHRVVRLRPSRLRTIGRVCRSIGSGRCSSPRPRPAKNRFVGQVEQMHESRCFRASEGRLGCISCHDPHRLPAPEEKVAYYRDRCLECHADRGCRLAVAGPTGAEPRR